MADTLDADEFYEERAAIMQFDGCMVLHEAEFYAIVQTFLYCQRRGVPEPENPRYRILASYFYREGAPDIDKRKK